MISLDLYARLQQGYVLDTIWTRRQCPEERGRDDAHERRQIFTGFTPLDAGQGRTHLAHCGEANTARRLVACWNACVGIEAEQLEQLDKIPPSARSEAFRQLIGAVEWPHQ